MPPSTEFIRHGKYKRATLERVFPVPTLNVTGFHGKPVMQRRPICRRQILHGPMFNLCMEALTRTRFGINRVSVIDGRRCGSVRLANVHKLGAEIRYLTNLRNLRELFRYPSPENSGGRQSRTKISVGSFSNLTFTSRQMPKMWAWRVSI